MKKLLTTAAVASALLLSPLAFAQQYYLVMPLNGGFGPTLKENEPAEPEESSANIELQLPFGLSSDLNKDFDIADLSYEDFINAYNAQPLITVNVEIEGGAAVFVVAQLHVIVKDGTSFETTFDNREWYDDLFTESGELRINTPDIDIKKGDYVHVYFDLTAHNHDDDSYYDISRNIHVLP